MIPLFLEGRLKVACRGEPDLREIFIHPSNDEKRPPRRAATIIYNIKSLNIDYISIAL